MTGLGFAPAPAAYGDPTSTPIVTTPAVRWAMGAWYGPDPAATNWASHRWTKSAWKDDSWSKAAWKSDGWLGSRWKDDDWVKVAWKDGDWS